MKKIKVILTMILSIALFGGMANVYAVSGSITTSTTNYQATLSRTITNCKQKVTNTFTYTVTPAATYSGVSGMPTSETVAFSGVSQSGGSCTATGTLSLSGASFSANGDYTYTITETASSDSTSFPVDSTNKYTVKISVRNKSATDFSAKVVTINWYQGVGNDASKKDNTTLTFTSAAVYRSITLKNTLEGTMADSDLYFPITVTINGTAGDSYTISGQSKSGAPTACTIASGATSCTATLQLKHNETATISGVRNNATYSFSESTAAPYSNYSTYYNGSTTNSKTSGNLTASAATNSNTVKNTYSASALTGIVTRYLPYVLVTVIAIVGIVFIALRNSRKDKEESIEE